MQVGKNLIIDKPGVITNETDHTRELTVKSKLKVITNEIIQGVITNEMK
jgi:hypothetical protein